MVFKSVIEEARAIPSIKLVKGGSVSGNLVGEGGSLKESSFFPFLVSK